MGADTNIFLSLVKAMSQACDHVKGTSLASKVHKGRAIDSCHSRVMRNQQNLYS